MRSSASSADSIFALHPKRVLNLGFAMRASPAHTTSATRSPTANESVLAMRSGSQPTAWAASSTVALEVSNSKTSPSRPYPARYLFALSNDMAPLLSILPSGMIEDLCSNGHLRPILSPQEATSMQAGP